MPKIAGEAAFSTDDGMSSGLKRKTNEPPSKKKYSDTSTSKNKGLFSRLKVQTVRSPKSSGVDRKTSHDAQENRSLTRHEDLESLDEPLMEDEEENKERLSSHEKGHDFVQRQDIRETSSHFEQNIEDQRSRAAKPHDFVQRQDVRETSSRSEQNIEDRRSRAVKPQKSFKEVVAEDFFSIKSFKDVGANDRILQSLQFMEMRRPSQIQVDM